MPKRRRVNRGPKHVPAILPKSTWDGGIFTEPDGTVCEVLFSGKHMPASEIERGKERCRKEGHPVGLTI